VILLPQNIEMIRCYIISWGLIYGWALGQAETGIAATRSMHEGRAVDI